MTYLISWYTFLFLGSPYAEGDQAYFHVLDKDTVSSDSIGEVSVALAEFATRVSVSPQWFELKHEGEKSGAISLQFAFV